MGDMLQNFEIFKKLGFDNSNQWIFYEEGFQNFFDFFTENITESNILTDNEVRLREELIHKKDYLQPSQRKEKMQILERENPGLLDYTESDIKALTRELDVLKESIESYTVLLNDMRQTRNNLNAHVCSMEEKLSYNAIIEKNLIATCHTKSKQLEELQRDNSKLSIEVGNSFTRKSSPSLFVHQLPLDQYFHKCDSFMQYFTLYMKEHFKIQDNIDLDNNAIEGSELMSKLEGLSKSIEYYTLEYIKEKGKVGATKSLIEFLDLTHIHAINLCDMERETRDLHLVNEHLKNSFDTLMNDLTMHVQQRIQQDIELILYENTKQKLQRALRRHENDKLLTKIISDALSNAELVWMLIQLDIEKVRNRFDNTDQLNVETHACFRRCKAMRAMQVTSAKTATSSMLLEKITELLSQHLSQQIRVEPKAVLYEYEKFSRLLVYALQGMIKKKPYTLTIDQLKELHNIEKILNPLVYDSPVESPMLENVSFLRPIFEAKIKQHRMEKILRNLRYQFQENITERMEKDKFWRYSQLLWIWFLTDPKHMQRAIEEVKKSAYNMAGTNAPKLLCGIKRK